MKKAKITFEMSLKQVQDSMNIESHLKENPRQRETPNKELFEHKICE